MAEVSLDARSRAGARLRWRRLASRYAIPVGIGVTILAVYFTAVTGGYAYSDDYPLLGMASGLGGSPYFGNNIIDALAANGRPFGGLLTQVAFWAAGTIDNLRFARLLGIAAIIALGVLLHWRLVRAGLHTVFAALIALVVCSMPAFEVFGSWAVVFTDPYAAVLAAGASILAVASAEVEGTLVLDRLLGAAALLFAAVLIYQPGAMFFWVFLAVALVGAARTTGSPSPVIRAHALVAAVGLPLGVLVGKLAVRTVGDTTPNVERYSLTHDPIGKLGWFFAHPLYQSLNLFALTPSPWFAVFVGVVAVAGLLLLLRRETAKPLAYLALAVAFVPLSFMPNLIAKENDSVVYRTQMALSALVVLYFALGALGIWLSVSDRLERRPRIFVPLGLTASAAFATASLVLAGYNVKTLVVDPQTTELRIVRNAVARLPDGVSRVGFVQIGWNQGLTKWYSDEIGLASSARPWTPQAEVLLILREEGRLGPGQPRPVVDLLPFATTTYPQNEPVIDLRYLASLR